MALKENNGKASKLKMSHQFVVILLTALVLVGLVRRIGTAPWHSKAGIHGDDSSSLSSLNNVDQPSNVTIVGNPYVEVQESNFIQFEFSNLDGVEGNTGIVVVELHPEWAPLGVKRMKELTAASFWEGCRAFRVLPNFVVQLGINGNPEVQQRWASKKIKDDPVKTSNERGTVTFATSGKGTRTTQIFFNIGGKNGYLDRENFAPFGKVILGIDVVDRIYQGYKERPDQGMIQQKGNQYLEKSFPKLSFITRAKFISPGMDV